MYLLPDTPDHRARSPRQPRQNRLGHARADAPAARTSHDPAPGRCGHSPSPPCSRRRSHARRAAARRSASPCAAASPAPSGLPPGSCRSPVAAHQAWASSPAPSVCSPVATKTGTSSEPSHGSTRKPAPPRAGCGPRQTQSTVPRHSCPRQTSPATPQRDQPNKWPGFTPPSSVHHRRSNGLVCHRRAHPPMPSKTSKAKTNSGMAAAMASSHIKTVTASFMRFDCLTEKFVQLPSVDH